jgi:hypothetical protein
VTPAGGPSPTPAFSPPLTVLSMCESVQVIAAPGDWYRATPIYVENEMPVDRLARWARRKPDFVEVWIDRSHNGWVTLAFTRDAEERQRELEAEFPGVGVVAVQVDYTIEALERLQRRVRDELPADLFGGSSIWVTKGLVGLSLGPLTPERVAEVERLFGDEPVCLHGYDPASRPAPGPQQWSGDGWRLLADEDGRGHPYRTGIAFNEASYSALWAEAGVVGDRPAVDFVSDVVLWFGSVHGSSCPKQRLDGVVVDGDRSLVYADIVSLETFTSCTDDAVPHAYLLALQRDRLPPAPFAIQLRGDDPPRGAPEERTVVDADLRAPGSIAGPGEVHSDPSLPEPDHIGPGYFLEAGFSSPPYWQPVRCGLEWIGPLNRYYWRTAEASGASGWLPDEWRDAVDRGVIALGLILESEPPATITATANGHSVVYEVTPDQPPACD